MKKGGESTRPFMYDLNQIPFDYTVEVINRFKGLDLVDRVPEELWTEVCDIVQKSVTKTIPKKKKRKKEKETLDWKKHKLESRLPGEISITSDMQMTPPLWQKVKRT